MRFRGTIIISALSLLAAGCGKEPIEINTDGQERYELTLIAHLPESKVSVSGEGKVTWTSGDAIALYNNAGQKFEATLSGGAGTNDGTFTCGSFSGEPGLAVYPSSLAGSTPGIVVLPWKSERTDEVPALMASTVSSVSSGVPSELYFRHIAPVVDITLHDVPAYARALVLHASGGRICGEFFFDTDALGPVQTEPVESTRMITFPSGAGYGTDLHFRIAIPAADYSSLSVSLLDGDESVIEGLGDIKFSASCLSLSAREYLSMPALDVRARCTRSASIRKVAGVRWAAGNLIAESAGNTSPGFQAGWRLASKQYEYLGYNTVGTSTSASFQQSTTAFDRFNWGGLAGDAWLPDAGYMLPTSAKFNISGRVFSASVGDSDTLDAAQVEGDARFAAPAGGSFATGSSLHGDVAFWASKGQYRMPTSGEMVLLRAGNDVGNATGKAGYVTVGGNRIYGILLTSTPSWEESALNTTAVALTEADLESGLFLPKTGRGRYISGSTSSTINYVNGQGYYRTSVFSGLDTDKYPKCDHATTVLGFRGANACDYGYTVDLNGDSAWGVGHVQKCLAIRPVQCSELSEPLPDPLPQPSAQSLPPWSEGYLDIHAINSGRGECTLVIMPDGTSMMIDAGELYSNTESYVPGKPDDSVRAFKVYSTYAKYFLSGTGHNYLDYFLLTHYHIDHMGSHNNSFGTTGNGYIRTGVMALYDDLPIIKLVDRCGPSNTPQTSDYSEAIYEDFRQFAQYRKAGDGMAWYVVNLNPNGNYKKQFPMKYNPSYDFVVANLGANGQYWNGSGFSSYTGTVYENGASVTQLISYGDFDYLTSGDCGSQTGIIQLIANSLGKKVEAMKAGHHLYYNTFDAASAAKLQPKVTLAQIFDSDKPGDPAFSYYKQYGDIFCTNLHQGRLDNTASIKAGTPISDLGNKVRDYNGHFVIRVSPGGSQFYVYKLRDTDFSFAVEAVYGPYSCH
ncbi:MAG: hypothetical protein J5533_03620 [Bacteroidales bacterium]|nr:hypothetical protein [Bacteroidales bacterium]